MKRERLIRFLVSFLAVFMFLSNTNFAIGMSKSLQKVDGILCWHGDINYPVFWYGLLNYPVYNDNNMAFSVFNIKTVKKISEYPDSLSTSVMCYNIDPDGETIISKSIIFIDESRKYGSVRYYNEYMPIKIWDGKDVLFSNSYYLLKYNIGIVDPFYRKNKLTNSPISIAGVHVEDTQKDVEDKLGKPSYSGATDGPFDGPLIEYKYSTNGLNIVFNNGKVVAVNSSSSNGGYRTVDGIGVGDSAQKLTQVYGMADNIKHELDGSDIYAYNDTEYPRIVFCVKNFIITYISYGDLDG